MIPCLRRLVAAALTAACTDAATPAPTDATDVADLPADVAEGPDTAEVPDTAQALDVPPPDVAPPADIAHTDTAAPPCTELSLVAQTWEGATTALYAIGTHPGGEGAFHLDSASYTSLLFLPAGAGWRDHAADVAFGCQTVPVPGWDGLGTLPDVEGYPVVGMAGSDLLRLGRSRLDVPGATLAWDPQDFDTRPGAIALEHEWVQGELLVQVSFDGEPVTAVVDTGAAHTLWLGREPAPGDQPVTTEDALGNPLTVWLGTATLGLGDQARTVAMFKAPSFPVLEETEVRLGRDLGGLVGLSAIDRLYVDEAGGVAAIRPAGLAAGPR